MAQTEQKLQKFPTYIASKEIHPFDVLTAKFQASVKRVAENPAICQQMIGILQEYNPLFVPINYPELSEAEVLGNVVGAIYGPMIHGYAASILKNIQAKTIPSVIIAPPRDAIPLATALQAQAGIKGVPLTILMPPVNRNTTGIDNNQKDGKSTPSPLLKALFDQLAQLPQVQNGVSELETGIYGTTSLVMAQALKTRGVSKYIPIKFYGLGPNLSYVHAVLSGGKGWIAEDVESQGLVNKNTIDMLMVLLDTMEELGMEKFYQSVESLAFDEDGIVIPIIVPSSPKEHTIAQVTNRIIHDTTLLYMDLPPEFFAALLIKVPHLLKLSQQGFPFTLEESIPSMDSKEIHFAKMRNAGVIDYPQNLVL